MPLCDGRTAVEGARGLPPLVEPRALVRLLERTQGLRTLKEHASAVVAEMSRRERVTALASVVQYCLSKGIDIEVGWRSLEANLVNAFERLCHEGAFVSVEELTHGEAPTRSEVSKISAIAIVTRERPAMLRRCAASYASQARRFGRSPTINVYDDSPSAQDRANNRSMLRGLSDEHDIAVRYAGTEEKQAFASALVDRGLPRWAVHYALFGPPRALNTVGANRNTALLDSVGANVLCVDDDTIGRVFAAPGGSSGLAVVDHDHCDQWYFPNRGAALAFGDERTEDILAHHEKLLGRGVLQSLAEFDQLDVLRVESRHPSLVSHASRVVLTMSGWIGHSGAAANAHVSDGDTRARIMESERTYRAALASKEVLRIPRSFALSSTLACMTTFYGLCCEELVPPFFPMGRVSDRLFGTVVRRLHGGFFGEVPRALLHDPAPDRSTDAAAPLWEVPRTYFTEMVNRLIGADPTPGIPQDPASTLRAVGERLADVGSMSAQTFEEYLRELYRRDDFRIMGAIASRSRRFGHAPEYWRDDLRRIVELRKSAEQQSNYLIPTDLPPGDDSPPLEQVRAQVANFGKLCMLWPDMVKEAQSLAKAGLPLARALVESEST